MNTMYSDQAVASLAPSSAEEDQRDQQPTGGFLYQIATILAILLLLFSA